MKSYDFAAGETAEGIAIAPDGTRYVSLLLAGALEITSPDGSTRRVVRPGRLVGPVAIDRSGAAWFTTSSPDPNGGPATVERLARGASTTQAVAVLPAGAQPNGVAFDDHGALYIADSRRGVVYRLPRASRTVQEWASGPALSQDTTQGQGDIVIPGPNGVKVFHGVVYVSNSSRSTILAIRIRRDATPGPVRVRYSGVAVDDFAFDRRGSLYVTTNPFQTVERIEPDGTRTVLATAADGLDGPSAVAFGVGPQSTLLYITNLGLFGTAHRPSLQSLDVGVRGAQLPNLGLRGT